jgi:hypothetical protein
MSPPPELSIFSDLINRHVSSGLAGCAQLNAPPSKNAPHGAIRARLPAVTPHRAESESAGQTGVSSPEFWLRPKPES